MTVNWENFELACTEYLNVRFGYYAKFILQGGADSTTSDILVKTRKGEEFYMEAKHSPAQCGQFVLLPNIKTRMFEYSDGNKMPENQYSAEIMAYMNDYFDRFRDAGTNGEDIGIMNGAYIFAQWIISAYKRKGVKYFITNDFCILSIDKIQEYFDITAKYRIKRSGSSKVGKKNTGYVMDYITSHDNGITVSNTKNGKIFVESDTELHNKRFILAGNEYMFSRRNEWYEVRKLSNTYNANVIFSIVLKSDISGISEADFINYLI